MRSAAQRMQALRARRKAEGLVRMDVWVLPSQRVAVRLLERKLRRGKGDRDAR